jgi:hypothetical protein
MRVFQAVAFFLIAFSASAAAEPKCISSPDDKWLTEAEMKAKAVAMGYAINVFKKTTGNCYEIYGKNAEGKRIEIYFNPVTGEPVKP